MNTHDLWNRYQDFLFTDEATGVSVDISRMNFDTAWLAAMEPRMSLAYAAMTDLEAGAIANPDEHRQVGHYWLRDPSRAPDDATRRAITDTIATVRHFAADVHTGKVPPERAEKFRRVLVVGIGGSALGPQFVAHALGNSTDPMRLYFLDNTDPDGMDKVLGSLRGTEGGLAETLAVVISKSGGTKETRNGMLEARAAWEAQGLHFARHAVAVTGDGSDLYRYATENGWLGTFPMWDWVGGRTSELSAVGLLPAALQGVDVEALLAGARAMDALTRVRDTRKNPAALLALMWFYAGNGCGKRDMVVLPYKDRLELFSRYLQQLVMESLGKERDLTGAVVHQGIAVYGNKGSTDQHAYVQQLREGVLNFFVTFIQVLRDRGGPSPEVEPGVTSGDFLLGFLEGTRGALYDNGRESVTVTVPDVSARTVGMLIALYERTVGLYASLVGINAYHQPGVEAGKKAAGAVIDTQKRALGALRACKSGTAEDIAKAGGIDDVESVYKVLRHAAANPDHGVKRVSGARPGQDVFGLES